MVVRAAVRHLMSEGHELVSSVQNAAEFCNVWSRPASARGGFGQTTESALKRIALLEETGIVLHETEHSYLEWKRLLAEHQISGVSVHDARLVSVMVAEGVDTLLTLNFSDFRRYQEIHVVTPEMVMNSEM